MLCSVRETGQGLVEYTFLLLLLAVAVLFNFILSWSSHWRGIFQIEQQACVLLARISRPPDERFSVPGWYNGSRDLNSRLHGPRSGPCYRYRKDFSAQVLISFREDEFIGGGATAPAVLNFFFK